MERKLVQQARTARRPLVLAVVLGLLGVVATIVQYTALADLINRVFLHGDRLSQAGPNVAVLVAAVAVRSVCTWGRELAAQEAAVRAKGELRGRLIVHLLALGPGFSRGERTGELVEAATAGIERLDPYFSRYLPQMALSALVPLAIGGYVLWLDRLSGALLLVTLPVVPVLLILVGSYSQEHIDQQWLALSRMSAYFLDVLQGLPTLRLFGRSRAEGARVGRISDEFRERTLKVLRYAFLSSLVLEFMTTAAIAMVAVMLGLRLLDGGIAYRAALLVLLLTPEFYRPLRELGLARHAAMEGGVAAERIFAVFDTPAPSHRGSARVVRAERGPEIRVNGIGYRYHGSIVPALDGVDLVLPASSRTALVGPSGSGKSTLVSLLLRFLEPEAGAILADGRDIASLDVESWRAQVALVSQQPYLFYGTVLENLRLARPGASDADVRRAAELAGAADFIDTLPRGYDTPLGERAARLSQGQARRLAIARAFLKDAPLLILDEPTSSLDPESEERIRVALDRLALGRTVLVIAHRLNTVFTADRIAVLDRGRVVEQGTHRELVARHGLYARKVAGRAEVPA